MSETKFTPGPWFRSGVRFRMDGGEWHSVNRYDEVSKKDKNIACVSYDPRTGDGFADANLIAAAPELYEALENLAQAYRLLCDDAKKPYYESPSSRYQHSMHILAKARGES